MCPGGGGKPSGKVAKAIDDAFGSYDEFAKQFKAAGATQFGSGWAWLVTDKSGKLSVTKSPNAETPIVNGEVRAGGVPCACALWREHLAVEAPVLAFGAQHQMDRTCKLLAHLCFRCRGWRGGRCRQQHLHARPLVPPLAVPVALRPASRAPRPPSGCVHGDGSAAYALSEGS